MTRFAVIVDSLKDWKGPLDGLDIVSADAFLADNVPQGRSPARVVNLCRRYDYLSAGYYCSLLAEARGQVPMPTVADVLSLQRKPLYAFALPELNVLLRRTLKRLAEPPSEAFALTVYFGHSDDERFKRLAAECFDIFRYPILKLDLRPGSRGWGVHAIRPLGLNHVPKSLWPKFNDALRAYTRTRKPLKGGPKPPLYSLAILVDPDDPLPPSDAAALDKFVRAGRELRMDVELIGKRDVKRVAEFDGLFIRATTAINHFTYQFAKKAELEGLAVIDDPTSILRCTNKVYLHELLLRHGLPTPRTRVIDRAAFTDDTVERLADELGYPLILKIPDGSFSRGMHKAANALEAKAGCADLFSRSRLILAQEYAYTPFDWRVGVLDGEPLYVCQYLMSRGHWQIVNHKSDGSVRQGGWKTFAIESAPPDVVQTAVNAARLIGGGFYGVDMKEIDRGPVIIEVNDNPSLEAGVEDKVLKDELYRKILKAFIRRIDEGA